jgi:superfamily II DNA/RNA helicase
MTRLIAKGLQEREIKFESLHGGVPGKKREILFKNFNEDPNCKVFLSTDAGGVGLNLQAAAYLINMDIPWNPAVLEQRIARIYRMGQKKNVSIINLVAEGTIEHRMLSVLKFKSSVAAGVLDNGEDSIFMGDDRFKQFMQSVEAISQTTAQQPTLFDKQEQDEIASSSNKKMEDQDFLNIALSEEPSGSTSDSKEPQPVELTTSVNSPDSLIQNGMNFFTQLIKTLNNGQAIKELSDALTEKDEKTGQTWLKLPVENKQTVEKVLHLLAGMLK